jgi:hypothetical protein
MLPVIIWTHYFLLEQGYGVDKNLLFAGQQEFNTIGREMGRHQAVSA